MKEIFKIIIDFINSNDLWDKVWLRTSNLKIILLLTNDIEIDIRIDYSKNSIITINKKEYSEELLKIELSKLLKEKECQK